jgi:hypothetical protein
MAEVPGGATELLARGYRGKEAARPVARTDPGWSRWSADCAATSGRRRWSWC